MELDYKWLKQIVDQTIITEGKCVQLLCELLAKENRILHSSTIEKVVSILSIWEKTPPSEILKQLDEVSDQKTRFDCVVSYAIMSIHGAIAYAE